MNTPAEWSKWLVESDSVESFAPEGYDDHAARVRAEELGRRLGANRYFELCVDFNYDALL